MRVDRGAKLCAVWVATLLSAFALNGCRKEVILLDARPPTAVVYATLYTDSPSRTAFRIQRSFAPNGQNANASAGIIDSNELSPTAQVVLRVRGSAQSTYHLQPYLSYNKAPGAFGNSRQQLFALPDNVQIAPGDSLFLAVSDTATGLQQATARAEALHPPRNFKSVFKPGDTLLFTDPSQIAFEWRIGQDAYAYTLLGALEFWEYTVTDSILKALRYTSMFQRKSNPGFSDYNTSHVVDAKDLYSALTGAFSDSIRRRVKGIAFEVIALDETIYNYVESINAFNNGRVDQAIFTNINGGVGFFGSAAASRIHYALHPVVVAQLAKSLAAFGFVP